jgi:distribution and morphology protein 34
MSVTSNATTSTNNINSSINNSHDTSLLSTSPPDARYYPDQQQHHQGPAKIVLRPTLNNSIHQLSTLSHSNHTLSPYTRDLSHFTVRSVPPRGVGVGALGFGSAAMGDKAPVKAKRKRMYRLGGKKPEQSRAGEAGNADTGNANNSTSSRRVDGEHPHHPHPHPHRHHGASSPTPPSEFDVEDMDRYFPTSQDDLERLASGTTATGVTSSPSLWQPSFRQKSPSANRTIRQRPTGPRQPSSVYAPL